MKIEKIFLPFGVESSSRPQEKTKTGGFKEILDQALTSPPETNPSAPVSFPPVISLEPEELEGIRQAEEILSIMDNIARLASQGPLSGSSSAQSLEERGFELSRLAETLKPGPAKSLMEEVATLATVEALKIRRGDYS